MFKVVSPKSCRASAELLEAYLNSIEDFEQEIRVNWGCSNFEDPKNTNVKGNTTVAVKNSVNKKETLSILKDMGVPVLPLLPAFHGQPVPPTYQGEVYCHTDTTSHNGKGVSLVKVGDIWNKHNLYTQGIKGTEFRFYFAYGNVVGVAEKVPVEKVKDTSVKSSKNGYGYQVMKLNSFFEAGAQVCLEAANKLGLSYGAIDIIYEEGTDKLYVLESNSAPCLFDNGIADKLASIIFDNVKQQ